MVYYLVAVSWIWQRLCGFSSVEFLLGWQKFCFLKSLDESSLELNAPALVTCSSITELEEYVLINDKVF